MEDPWVGQDCHGCAVGVAPMAQGFFAQQTTVGSAQLMLPQPDLFPDSAPVAGPNQLVLSQALCTQITGLLLFPSVGLPQAELASSLHPSPAGLVEGGTPSSGDCPRAYMPFSS